MQRGRLLCGLVASLMICGPVPAGFCEDAATTAPAPVAGGYASPVDSTDASAHLHYASILFYKARLALAEDEPTGRALFQEVEAELQLASTLSHAISDQVSRSLLRSQCAFLRGDLSLYITGDPEKAQAYYQESLRNFPDHAGAAGALERLGVSPHARDRSD